MYDILPANRIKAFIDRLLCMVTMTNPIENSLVKHKHIIMLTIAAAALIAYMLPFDNMMGVADATKKKEDKRKSYDSKKPSTSSSTTIGISQHALQNSGILVHGGGGGSEAVQEGNTAFNFLQQSQQVCSGTSNCPNTQAVQFAPITTFPGGP
jgi:hypothetical protein